MVTPSIPTSFKSIIDMVGDRIVELLTAYCKTSLESIPEAADFVAGEIRQGNYQQDPTEARIALLVHPSNPDDMGVQPKFMDRPNNPAQSADWLMAGPREPAYEFGGGSYSEMWERTFTIDIEINLTRTKEDRDRARQIGLWVFGRAHQALRENSQLGLRDDFGETALYMVVVNVNPYEAGGPPADFIWRGRLWAKVITCISKA